MATVVLRLETTHLQLRKRSQPSVKPSVSMSLSLVVSFDVEFVGQPIFEL